MRIAFFSAAVLASSLATAATPVDGWYSSVFGGYSYLPNNISNTHFGLSRTGASYTGGFNAGGRIGFQSNPLRYEAEFTYIQANVKHFQINRIIQKRVGKQVNASLGMANVYYDFPEMVPCISPFVGVGLGYGFVEAQLKSRGPFYTVGPYYNSYFKGSNSVFAYQATAGVTYNFAENYALNLAYRYVGTDRVHELGKVFQANLASVGVIYRFDQATYK